MKIPVICIDGPTASGKGTLALEIARRLGYNYLDSGALYRILGLAARCRGLSLDGTNGEQIAALTGALSIQFDRDKVLLDGKDVSDLIRTEQAGMDASRLAVLPEVRSTLLGLQKSFRREPGLVADGRDMGTIVFPDSTLKIFLTASAEQRAGRRHRQLLTRGLESSLELLRADLEARDSRDSHRSVAPLVAAADAHLLDNSELSVEESVDQVLMMLSRLPKFLT